MARQILSAEWERVTGALERSRDGVQRMDAEAAFAGLDDAVGLVAEIRGDVAAVRVRLASPGDRIRELRDAIAGCEERIEALECELAEALEETGRRPGDGSDQATLFDVAEPNLFGG